MHLCGCVGRGTRGAEQKTTDQEGVNDKIRLREEWGSMMLDSILSPCGGRSQ